MVIDWSEVWDSLVDADGVALPLWLSVDGIVAEDVTDRLGLEGERDADRGVCVRLQVAVGPGVA